MLWIWDVKRDYLLANLVFVSPVVAFQWNPVELELAVVTTNQTLYFWKQGELVWSLLPNRRSPCRAVMIRNRRSSLAELERGWKAAPPRRQRLLSVVYYMTCLFRKQGLFRSNRNRFTNPQFRMEEKEDSAQSTPATFQFDFSTYELVAQGAEGVGSPYSSSSVAIVQGSVFGEDGAGEGENTKTLPSPHSGREHS